MDKFHEQMTKDTKFGEHKVVLTSGGMDMLEPIGLRLVPVYEAMNSNFYIVADSRSMSPCKHTDSLLRSQRSNLQRILKEYLRLKRINTPVGNIIVISQLNWYLYKKRKKKNR